MIYISSVDILFVLDSSIIDITAVASQSAHLNQPSVFHFSCIMLDQKLKLIMSLFSQNVFNDHIHIEFEILIHQIIDDIFHHFRSSEIKALFTLDHSFFSSDSNIGVEKVEEFINRSFGVLLAIQFSPDEHVHRHRVVDIHID